MRTRRTGGVYAGSLPRNAGLFLAAAVITASPSPARAQWYQFGGPTRDFRADATGLATEWPEDGPKRLWQRELGDAFSGIVADDGTLYTMYRDGGREVVVALNAATGETRWEHRYSAPPFEGMTDNFGVAPRSTPLIDGDRVYTLGIRAMLHCLDKRTGKVLWSHDMMEEYGAKPPRWGYSASALAYKDTIIVPVGGPGHGVMAFDKSDGSVVWAKHDYPAAYASPMLIDVDGQEQLVAFMQPAVVGLNPGDGALLWSSPHTTDYDVNASQPIWCPDNTLVISSAYNSGSRGLKLTRSGDKTEVEQLWHQRKMKIHFGSAIRIGDLIYGSSGGNGPVFFAAVDVRTGKMAFRKRGLLAKAQLLYADGKLILLDEDGHLAIGTPTPEGLTLHARAPILERIAWTAPALVGKTLYVRDRKHIMALDLG